MAEDKTGVIAPAYSRRKAHCNKCLRVTNHDVLYSETVPWEEEILYSDGTSYPISGSDTYALLRCAGCEDVRMLHAHWFSEDYDEQGQINHEDYYPPAVKRAKPAWVINGLPIRLGLYEFGALLDEIYRALSIKALRLVAMGIRALVEKMMIDRVGDHGSFEKNIGAFLEGGYVAGVQQKMFRETLIEAGHAAMHREWEPSDEDVTTLLDIVEGLIRTIYVDPSLAEKVGKRIPPRGK